MAKYKLTQDTFISEGIIVELDESELGQHKIFQKLPGNFRWKERRPIYVNTTYHPYGRDKQYLMTSISLHDEYGDRRSYTLPLHKLLYIYYNGNYPEGYDISHKDDDAFNCHPDNLEAIPHVDNIRKRKCNGSNQFKNSSNWDSYGI